MCKFIYNSSLNFNGSNVIYNNLLVCVKRPNDIKFITHFKPSKSMLFGVDSTFNIFSKSFN